MTQEIIEKEIDARLDEPDNNFGGIFNNGYSQGFRNGARWRIASVWHDARNETPEEFKPILAERDNLTFSVNMAGRNMASCPAHWVRWAYIDDLLPEGKGGLTYGKKDRRNI